METSQQPAPQYQFVAPDAPVALTINRHGCFKFHKSLLNALKLHLGDVVEIQLMNEAPFYPRLVLQPDPQNGNTLKDHAKDQLSFFNLELASRILTRLEVAAGDSLKLILDPAANREGDAVSYLLTPKPAAVSI